MIFLSRWISVRLFLTFRVSVASFAAPNEENHFLEFQMTI